MKDIIIIGGGGFGREVQWLIERINQKSHEMEQKKTWNIIGYVDDNIEKGTLINGTPVLGDLSYLNHFQKPIAVVCSIGAPLIRKSVIENIKNTNIYFPNLMDPSVIMSDLVELGQGNTICAGTIITVNTAVGHFNIVNLGCTIGHDAKLGDFVTLYPSVNVSGNVDIGEATEIGTGAQVIQGVQVAGNSIVGAGAVVTKDIVQPGKYIGIPARGVESWKF